jgi:3-phosphoinositide dependent protein kinase-1
MDESSERQFSPSDFIYGTTIGEGRFGTVIYAELKPAKQDPTAAADASSSLHESRSRERCRGYAIKVIPKCELFRCNQIQAVMTEKHILCEVLSSENSSASELFMKLFMCFHDASFVYFVLELCAGGTLLGFIQSRAMDSVDPVSPVMGVSWVQYYSGQVLRAIEYLHQRGVVHRDISPQNIALTFPNGEIKLGDFGGAAILEAHEHEGESRRWVPTGSPPGQLCYFVGTPGYASPEMIRGRDEDDTISPSTDVWSFGCLVYHMFVGKSPFHAASDHLAFQRVSDYSSGMIELCFPSFIEEAAKDLISLLLTIDPANRLGMEDGVIESYTACHSTETGQKRYLSIRDHSFFHTSIWNSLETKIVEPPHKPAQPKWMVELYRGDKTLESFESVHFDL